MSLVCPVVSINSPSSSVSLDNIALLNGCQPFRVILDRLPQETIDFYTNKSKSGTKMNGFGGGTEDDEDIEEDSIEEKEPTVLTIDLEGIDTSSLNSGSNNVRSSRMKLDEKIFCLFNLEEFDDQYEAVQSFYRELKYAPFRCAQCDEATIELKGLLDHFINSHPDTKKAQYWVETISSKEKWVSKFIKYQIDCHEETADMFPNSYANKYCPVCNHFDYLLRSDVKRCKLRVSSMCDMNHINKHLRYNPWECVLCRQSGHRYAISSVNKKAHDHLVSRHGLNKSIDSNVYFKSTATIPELDNFLREYIAIIRDNEIRFSKPVVRRKPLAGKPNRTNANRGKQSGQLYQKASASYRKIKESRDSIKTVKKVNTRKAREYKEDTPEDIDDYQPFKDESSKYFCIFCTDNNLSDIYDAWGHYGNHLKYAPIICGICNKTFTSDESLRYHGIEHMDHSDLPFTRNCDEAIEFWGHEFLAGLGKDTEAKPEFAEYCPVCEKIFSRPIDPPHHPAHIVKSHIYSHLRYHPFECIPCTTLGGAKTFVGELDYQAAFHLKSSHDITATPSEIPSYFVKSRGIDTLDKLLADHFTKIKYLIGPSTDLTSTTSTPITGLINV